jgi:hypothetical protein
MSNLDEILHRAGLMEGFYRISASDKSTVNVLSDIDTYDETKQAIEKLIEESYKKGYIDGGIAEMTR